MSAQESSMRKIIALALLALALAGGVAAITAIDTRPAAAGCGTYGC